MKVRISIGNLVPRALDTETGQEFFFGIMYRKALIERNIRRVIALGGAAHMTDRGIALLREKYKAEMTNDRDARLIVEELYVPEIMDLFQRRDPEFYETEPNREVIEELIEEALPPIMNTAPFTRDEVAEIEIGFTKTVIQGASDRGSLLEVKGVPTKRLFNLFTLSASRGFLDKLRTSPAFRVVSTEQIRKTMAGEKLRTTDGVEIGDNIVW